MVAKLLDGKKTSAKYVESFKSLIERVKLKYKKVPKLTVILVGENPASLIYVKNKQKRCEEIGISSEVIRLKKDVSQKKLLEVISKLNKDKKVNGVLVQLPLPSHIDEEVIINAVSPEKDVDGFNVINKGKLFIGDKSGFIPCTPLGILKMLGNYKIKIDGKKVVVLGRSFIVGKPMAELMLQNNATVTICHSHTKNLKDITKSADILISAMGVKAGMIKSSYVKDGAVVVDVAMIRNPATNKLVGDVDFKSVSKIASYMTPVPGGVGPMTIAMLMNNTIKAFLTQNNIENEDTQI
ncbi:bifunctional methylenetetrahydrofolate dehydrogenase/methenyltetrahydrofolate cyclohydrolase FolD [bacterium]|nr:bifunctional methylenetetrahydrofolate dehydrogenase/methenyltetrahydrofolate cyclohydrolase FolD [bacterium]